MRRRMQHGARNLFLQEQIQDIIIIIGRRGASDVQKRFRGGVTARPAPRATVGIAHAAPWTPPGGPPPTHWSPRGVGRRGGGPKSRTGANFWFPRIQPRFRGVVTARPGPRPQHLGKMLPGPPPAVRRSHMVTRAGASVCAGALVRGSDGPRGAQSHEPAFRTSKMSRPRRNPKATPKAKDADAFCSRNDCPARHAERRNT
jgi:hypothetical protein